MVNPGNMGAGDVNAALNQQQQQLQRFSQQAAQQTALSQSQSALRSATPTSQIQTQFQQGQLQTALSQAQKQFEDYSNQYEAYLKQAQQSIPTTYQGIPYPGAGRTASGEISPAEQQWQAMQPSQQIKMITGKSPEFLEMVRAQSVSMSQGERDWRTAIQNIAEQGGKPVISNVGGMQSLQGYTVGGKSYGYGTGPISIETPIETMKMTYIPATTIGGQQLEYPQMQSALQSRIGTTSFAQSELARDLNIPGGTQSPLGVYYPSSQPQPQFTSMPSYKVAEYLSRGDIPGALYVAGSALGEMYKTPSPQNRLSDWLATKPGGIDITQPATVNIPLFSLSGGGNIPLKVPTPLSMIGDIERARMKESPKVSSPAYFFGKLAESNPITGDIKLAYEQEVKGGREPGFTKFFMGKLGQGVSESAMGYYESYAQTSRGKPTSPWAKALNPNYKYLPETKILGKVVDIATQTAPYFVPYLGEGLILAPFGEAALRGDLKEYAIKNPFEVAAAATLGLARGYQFYKYATKPIKVWEGWITKPQEKLKMWREVIQPSKGSAIEPRAIEPKVWKSWITKQQEKGGPREVIQPLEPKVWKSWITKQQEKGGGPREVIQPSKGSAGFGMKYQIRQSFTPGEYAVVKRPRILDLFGVSNQDITFVKDITPKTKYFQSSLFDIKKPTHLVFESTENVNKMSAQKLIDWKPKIFYVNKDPTSYFQISPKSSYQGRLPTFENKGAAGAVWRSNEPGSFEGITMPKKTVIFQTIPIKEDFSKKSAQELIDWKLTSSKYATQSQKLSKVADVDEFIKYKESGIPISKGRTTYGSDLIVGNLKPTGREMSGYLKVPKITTEAEPAAFSFNPLGKKALNEKPSQDIIGKKFYSNYGPTTITTQIPKSVLKSTRDVNIFIPSLKVYTPSLDIETPSKTGLDFWTGVLSPLVLTRTQEKERLILEGELKTMLDVKVDTDQIPRFIPAFTQPLAQSLTQSQAQAQAQVLVQVPISAQLPKSPVTPVFPPPPVTPRTPPNAPPPTPPEKKIKIPSIPEEERKKKVPLKIARPIKKPLAFEVAVRKKGKFQLAAGGLPLVKGEALALGVKIIRTTPSATFKLIPTGKAAGTLGLPKISEAALNPMYRTPQRKKVSQPFSNTFILKSRYRLSTPERKQAITYLGLSKIQSRSKSNKVQW